jgi:molecular chaperone DnaK (HSP70)
MQEPIVGIDLGTTNSVIAYVKDGEPVVIKDSEQAILPSVVGLTPDGQMLVGEAAKNQYLLYPEQTVRSIKRKMGSDEKVRLGDKTYTPQEISAFILLKLKKIAEGHFGKPLRKAVVTVPAYFSDAQRKATKEGGEIAGWEVMRIINEPTAAALAYETSHEGARKILVYDLGGGTFDVSVVNIQDGVVEVLASHGNNHLGGDDFDAKIVEKIRTEFREANEIDLQASTKSFARLNRAAEEAKIHLSDNPFAKINEEYIIEKKGVPLHLATELVRNDYEDLILHYIEETMESVHIALRDAKLSASDIEHILLVGGATRTPLVREMLAEKFDIEPRHEISPDLCVALGAAIQGAMIAGDSVTSVLVDITPYTFGTSAVGMLNGITTPHKYVPIIRKNTALPVSKSEVFFTMHDNQKACSVDVFQGEHEDARHNIPLGEFLVEGLSRVPSGNEIVIRFDLDLNGILHATATEKTTGLEKSIRIENAMAEFDEEQITAARERVGAFFDEDIEPGEVIGIEDVEGESELAQKANDLIEKARAKLNDMPEADRQDVENLMAEIREALKDGDDAVVEKSLANLEDILFFIET